jgi:prepilin-type N-terminal cleavage/methylation domain-containing protein
MNKSRIHRSGMTLTEMLVVIAIIATMMALLIPAVQWARERGRMATCQSNLKQIGLAFGEHNNALGSFPHAGLFDPNDPTPPWSYPDTVDLNVGPGRTQPFTAWGWAYQIMPYLEREREQKQLAASNGMALQVRLEAAALPMAGLFCPTRSRERVQDGTGCGLPDSPRGAIDYAGNGGYRNKEYPNLQYGQNYRFPVAGSEIKPDGTVIPAGHIHPTTGFFIPERDKPGQGALADGASSTILAGERRYNFLREYEPLAVVTEDNGFMAGYTWDTIRWAYEVPGRDYGDTTTSQDTRFGSAHTSGAFFLFADGAVKPLRYDVDLTIFRQLAGRDDGAAPTIP